MADSPTSGDGIPNTRFATGEAERLVTELRDCLRQDDRAGAIARFETLARRLTLRFERRAGAYFSRRPDLVEDAIQEAVVTLWRRLSDLRDLPGLHHFEVRFDQALKSLLLDAFASVYHHAHAAQEVADSTTAAPQDSDERDPQTALSHTPCPDAAADYEAVASTMFVNAVLAAIPDVARRRAFLMEMNGVPRERIAAEFRCSVRTIYNWIQSAKATLRVHLVPEVT